MHQKIYNVSQTSLKLFRRVGTKIYFRKDTERRFFFVLTLIMLVLGILSKIGIF